MNHLLCWAAFSVTEGGSLWWAGTNRVDWDDTSLAVQLLLNS